MRTQIRKWLLLSVFFFIIGVSVSIFYQTHATNQLTFGADYPEGFEKVFETYKHIQDRYIEDIPTEKLIDGAIQGMLQATGDPYTSYMTPQAANEFENSIHSSFEGIGAEVTMDAGRVRVVSPIKGSPAERAGILPGDYVYTVDGESVEGLTLTETVLKIRGPKGSTVKIEIGRDGQKDPIMIQIVRDTIPLETVYAEVLDNNIGKIEITQFSTKTDARFAEEFKALQQQGIKGLIIDVRNNPGGTLDSVVKISNLLVPNQGIILQVEDHLGKREVIKSELKDSKLPVVVLIDRGSASAAEILAAALQESAGYKVVGVNSFGKGSVQTTERFADGSEIKFTIAKWLTPKGTWINQVGVKPDYEVQLPEVFSTPRIPYDVTLKFDDNSTNVRSLQIMLSHLGFDPGRVDGYFSRETEKALLGFQEKNKLSMTGVAAEKDITAITDAVVKTMEESDTQLHKAIEVLQQQITK